MAPGPLSTVTEIVGRFGGPVSLAQRLTVSPFAVYKWRARGAIPPKWHRRLLRMAAQEGIELTMDELDADDLNGEAA